MRIAHVSDCYLPCLGGIETQVHDLAVRQQADGHQVEIVTSALGDGSPAGQGDRAPECVRVHRPMGGPARQGHLRYAASLRGRDTVLSGGYDVVHVHSSTFSPLGFLTAAAASRAGIPTVFTLHSLWSYATPAFLVTRRPLRWTSWPVAWSAVSDAAAGPLRRALGSRADVSVLPNGIDPDQWRTTPATRQPLDVMVVSVMRLAARKRPRQLLRMLRDVRDELPGSVRLTAVIAGEGPQRAALQRLLVRNDMTGWVGLPGRLSREQVRQLLARADVFVAPANLESFGIAALEARCAGVPVVAKSATGIRDFVEDGDGGLLTGADGDMVRAITRLASDGELRASMAMHNRAVPPKVTWSDVLPRCDALYQSAADRQVEAGQSADR